jgi:hypothetical protein
VQNKRKAQMIRHHFLARNAIMFSLLSSVILRALNERADFPDHLKDHADRYIRSPRAERRDGVSRRSEFYGRNLW